MCFYLDLFYVRTKAIIIFSGIIQMAVCLRQRGDGRNKNINTYMDMQTVPKYVLTTHFFIRVCFFLLLFCSFVLMLASERG